MVPEITEKFLSIVEDIGGNPVPEIHFQIWQKSPDDVRQRYIRYFHSDPATAAWCAEGYFAEDPDFDRLLTLAPDTLGHQYARHIVDNNLKKTIASDYRREHEGMVASGNLNGMPEDVRYAIQRAYQLHDILHILTGYLTDGYGEIALQAFTLAQLRLPYSSVWMATLTTQMTFLRPDETITVMDAITDGWTMGRKVRNLNYIRWEDRFDQPLAQLRAQCGLN